MPVSEFTTPQRQVLIQTASVCPVCLERIPAERVAYGDQVFLEKTCPQHGFFKTIIWRGIPEYPSWNRLKIPNHPRKPLTEVEKGCPYDCGPCAVHRQEPCCVLLEVTQRCDLGCPVCFAGAGESEEKDPDLAAIEAWYQRMLDAGGPFNIQLSGGEPCLRDDLPEIISLGKRMGFSYFQVNTNGLRIAADADYLRELMDAGLKVVYLQFDGTENPIYTTLRGRAILQQKRNAIENCREVQIGVVLVPTIAPGINDGNIGGILQFALEHFPTVRGIHFQPISFFGRYPNPPLDKDRVTLPELLRAMESQTAGLVHVSDFHPKGSENAYCSFHATYVIQPDGSLKPIKPKPAQSCCDEPESAAEGLTRSQQFVAEHWGYREIPPQDCTCKQNSLDAFLERAKTHLFSISGMAFQDAWNLDLDLLQDCCINVSSTDGKLVPFCAYNLTNLAGSSLYRPVKERGFSKSHD